MPISDTFIPYHSGPIDVPEMLREVENYNSLTNRLRLGVDDAQRTTAALKGIVGKRLTYKQSHCS